MHVLYGSAPWQRDEIQLPTKTRLQHLLLPRVETWVHTHTDPTHTSFPIRNHHTCSPRILTLVWRFACSILPIQSLIYCQAAKARLATSKLPQPWENHKHCCCSCHPQQLHLHNQKGPAAGKQEFLFLLCLWGMVGVASPESSALGGFCQPCTWCEPRRDTVLGMVNIAWPPQHLPRVLWWVTSKVLKKTRLYLRSSRPVFRFSSPYIPLCTGTGLLKWYRQVHTTYWVHTRIISCMLYTNRGSDSVL